jgi:hypothetical protein
MEQQRPQATIAAYFSVLEDPLSWPNILIRQHFDRLGR